MTAAALKQLILKVHPHLERIVFLEKKSGAGPITRMKRFFYRIVAETKTGAYEDIFVHAKKTGRNEYIALQKISARPELASHVPKPLAYESVTKLLFYEDLWGDTMRRFPFRERADDLVQRFSEAGRLLAEIQRTPIPQTLLRNPPPEDDLLKERLNRLQQNHAETLSGFSLTPPQEPASRPRRLIHGDFQASNLILTLPTGTLGVIDFSHAAAADPVIDAASFHIHGELMLMGHLHPKKITVALRRFDRSWRRHSGSFGENTEEALTHARFVIALRILETTLNFVPSSAQNRPAILATLKRYLGTHV